MLGVRNLVKPERYIPLCVSKRSKVRILPKEHFEDYEAVAAGHEKPKVKTFPTDFYSIIHREKLTWAHFRNWMKWREVKKMQEDQEYLPERHRILGPDLATTHFIAARNGKVKFVGNDAWITAKDIKEKKVPDFRVPGFFVEEVDVSGLDLCYEGFDNLCNLTRLKRLNLSYCNYIDDWCLSRNHLFANSLEYLDISGCHQVTERGICTLHSLKKLKTLVIKDTPNIQNKELVSLMLQDVIPECEIIGVDYNNPSLLKRIEQFMH